MASLDSVKQKLYRARHHRLELDEELLAYYRSDPVKLQLAGMSLAIGASTPAPARFGLIAGDIMQNLRSSLDYLIWELVLANGAEPNRQNAFPTCLRASDYKNEVDKRRRIQGIHPSAAMLIERLQPMNMVEPSKSPLAILDHLTNIGKHRRVLLTDLKREVYGNEPLRFPHLLSDLMATAPGMPKGRIVTFGFYIAFDEGSLAGTEIGTALDIFGDFIINEVLPPFEKFFTLTDA